MCYFCKMQFSNLTLKYFTERKGSREKSCLMFEQYDQKKFEWQQCSVYMPAVCGNGNNLRKLIF